jgi:hypothetical protein
VPAEAAEAGAAGVPDNAAGAGAGSVSDATWPVPAEAAEAGAAGVPDNAAGAGAGSVSDATWPVPAEAAGVAGAIRRRLWPTKTNFSAAAGTMVDRVCTPVPLLAVRRLLSPSKGLLPALESARCFLLSWGVSSSSVCGLLRLADTGVEGVELTGVALAVEASSDSHGQSERGTTWPPRAVVFIFFGSRNRSRNRSK